MVFNRLRFVLLVFQFLFSARLCWINLVVPQPSMQASWHSAYANFFAVVDVDAGGGGNLGAHGLAHQVVVVGIKRTARVVRNHLVDTSEGTVAVTHTFIDDLAILNDMAQAAPFLIVSVMVWFTR